MSFATHTSIAAAALSALLLLPAGGHAQDAQKAAERLARNARVKAALEYLARTEPQAIEDQIAICEIPAPPFKEARRGEDYRRRLEAVGLTNVRVDEVGNVIGEFPGDPGEPVIVIAAHLDTVFPEGTDVTVKREGNVLRGPGISDDCRGLTVLLAVARALRESQLRTKGSIFFVGDVGEEGLGNLRGVKHLYEKELKGRIDYFISVDGAGSSLTKDAVGSNRYEVTYRGPGGHSYGNFGMPSPIHALGRAIAKIADIQVPARPKTTFNVGVIGGGTSVNSIAMSGSMLVDMRSPDTVSLARVDAQIQAAIQAALAEENARGRGDVKLTVDIDTVGLRPAGSQPATAPIVLAGLAAAKLLGFAPAVGASSTDANVPINLGLPGVTIDGGGDGRLSHSVDETFDTTDSHLGPQWALLFVLLLAGLK